MIYVAVKSSQLPRSILIHYNDHLSMLCFFCVLTLVIFFYFLTVDPRLWSREDVGRWLRWVSDAYSLPDIKPDRFEMNGKGLCLMTLDMFLYRVPEGGRVLYHDFQRRLRIAVGS